MKICFTGNGTTDQPKALPSMVQYGTMICNMFLQAQPQSQSQLSWTELALVLFPPAAHLVGSIPGLVVNKQEISSTCFVTLEGLI